MSNEKEFDNILNECLERLLVKGETIEQCLQSYPEQAADLKPLLSTALAAREAVAIQPQAEFKARARYQFRSALQEAASPRRRFFLGWLPHWAPVVAIVLAVLLAGGSTIAAASNSMPDGFLYPVKLATEQAQLAITFSDTGKAKLCAEFADRRVAEIIYIADNGDAQQVETVTQRLDKRLSMLASLTSATFATSEAEEAEDEPSKMFETAPATDLQNIEDEDSQEWRSDESNRDKLRIMVARYAVNHPAGLRAALAKAPESTRVALQRAIAVSEAGYKRALQGWD